MPNKHPSEFDKPYPLQKRFRRWGLPAAAATFVILAILVGFGGKGLIEGIYLNLAESRARTIDLAIIEEAPEAWRKLTSGANPKEIYADTGGQALARALTGEVRELGLARLKIYNSNGIIVFSTTAAEIGTEDPSEAFRRAINDAGKTVVNKTLPGGGSLYELYVPLSVAGASNRAVFELYETTSRLDEIMITALLPAIAVPGLLLILLFWALDHLVVHAQADITGRARLVQELRNKLERLISSSAVDAAVDSVGKGRMESKKIVCTLLYSDVRNFTGYAESHTSEQVVAFLNELMGLQVAAIDAQGGDVDKMIGDAILARFEGEDAPHRAIAAARQILTKINDGDFPLKTGIGIFSGEVISGLIGSAKRMDFTVIGDSVNISARLCSAAAGGQLVVDTGTLDSGGCDDANFSAVEEIAVKGRSGPLQIRRWQV